MGNVGLNEPGAKCGNAMHDQYLHLFVDDRETSMRQHLQRMVQPVRRESTGPVLQANGQDEGTVIGYATVVRNAQSGVFSMWYLSQVDRAVRLAVSDDGMTWQRRGPAAVDGQRLLMDNLAMVPVSPEADPWFSESELAGYGYCLGSKEDESAPRGLHLLRSTDGERLEAKEPGILIGVGDRSSLTYDEVNGEYSLISRPSGRTPGFRPGELSRIRTANLWKSRNLVDWENCGIVLKYDDLDRHDAEIYGMQPFRYGNGFLALVEIYYGAIERLESQLAFSRDGVHWERVGDRAPTVPMGGEGAWDSHWTVSTNNPPFVEGDRLLIFYSGAGTKHGSKERGRRAIGLASLRKDGWVSLEAGRTEGVVVTAPLPLGEPMQLELNVDCHSGYISTEVMSAEEGKEAQALVGYKGDASRLERIDATCHPVRWREKRVVDPVESGRCYLRFAMTQTSFFSYRWRPAT